MDTRDFFALSGKYPKWKRQCVTAPSPSHLCRGLDWGGAGLHPILCYFSLKSLSCVHARLAQLCYPLWPWCDSSDPSVPSHQHKRPTVSFKTKVVLKSVPLSRFKTKYVLWFCFWSSLDHFGVREHLQFAVVILFFGSRVWWRVRMKLNTLIILLEY